MRILLVAALLAGTAATPAMAQDVAANPFTGLRVEGLVGYDTLQAGSSANDEDESTDNTVDGVAYGVGAGFDFDLGGAVLGIEGEFMDSSGEQESDENINGVPTTFGLDISRDVYIGGRVGFAVAPSTLLYAKGGYTSTRLESQIEDATDSVNFDTSVDGYRIGAGLEQQFGAGGFGFGASSYGKIEYRYSNYSDFRVGDDVFEDDGELDVDLDRHQVLVGLGVRF